jgi:drug/metabolite transporter (DMT)-like permease
MGAISYKRAMTTPPVRSDDSLRGILFMCLTAIVVFPLLNSMVKHLLAADYSVVQIMWMRSIVHVVWMAALFMPGRGLAVFRSNRPGLQLFRSGLQFLSLVLFVIPLAFVPLTTLTTAFFTAPLMVVALSVPLLGERVGPRRWAAVAVGFAGAVVIIRPGGDLVHWSIFLVLGSAASYALFQILTRRLAVYDDYRTTAVYTIVVALVLTTCAVPFFWEWPREPMHWVIFLGLGILGGLGHILVIKAYQYGRASVVGPFDYSQLIGATVVGFLWFAEIPDLWTWIGAGIIVASGVYITRREARVKGEIQEERRA